MLTTPTPEAAAWNLYLLQARHADELRYPEVEASAWAQLGRRLLELERERAKTQEPVAA